MMPLRSQTGQVRNWGYHWIGIGVITNYACEA